jgi:hypothetical protein
MTMMTTTAFDRHTQIYADVKERPWPLAAAIGTLGALRYRRDHPSEGRNTPSPIGPARIKYGLKGSGRNARVILDKFIPQMEQIVEEEKDKAHRRYLEVTM